jgi:hypothetical protein
MFRRTLVLVVLLLAPVVAHASTTPQPASPPPTLIVRLAPLDTLFDDVKLVGSMFGKEDPTRVLDEAIKSKLGPKGLFGIDGKRPIGFYGRVGKDISDLNGVLMLPIHSDKEFKEMLHAMDWKVTVDKDGIHTVKQDLLPIDVQYRVAHKYAYIGLLGQQEELLKPANLIAPEKIFTTKHKTAISLSLRIDQIPEDVRDALLKGLSDQFGGLADLKKGDAQKLPKSFEDTLKSEIERIFTSILKDGEELTALIDIEAKTKQLKAELSLTAKPNSDLAKSFQKLGQRKTLFAGVLHKDAALNGLFSFELPPALKEAANALVKDAAAKVLGDTKDEKKKEQAAKLLNALTPSLTSGDIDAAFCLRGPHKNKTFTLVAGFKLKDGDKLAAAVFELLKELPETEQKLLKLNAHQAGAVMIHQFDLHQLIGEAKDFVGENPLFFAFRDDALFVAIGDEGLQSIKQALAASAKDTAPIHFDMSLARLANVFEKAGPIAQQAATLLKKGEDARLAVSLEGGSELRLRFTMNLSVLQLFLDKSGAEDKEK